MSSEDRKVNTYSLLSLQKSNDDGSVDGSWIQDCVGTIDEAILAASRTSESNHGAAIVVTLSGGSPPAPWHLHHCKKPVSIVMAAPRNDRMKLSENALRSILKEVSLNLREMISSIDEDRDREISANERVLRIRQQLRLLLESTEGER